MSIKNALWDWLVTDTDITDLVDLRVFPGVSYGEPTGLLTLSGNVANTETVTIDAKTYTFQLELTDTDGNVVVGETVNQSIDNLVAAINLAAGAGSTYAASTTRHTTVEAERPISGGMTVIALDGKNTAYATTETIANGSWGQATMNVYPYVVLTRISAVHGRHMTAADGLVLATFQIDVFSPNGVAVEAVADAIRERMHGKGRGDIGTPAVAVSSMTLIDERDTLEPPDHGQEPGIWRTSMDFNIWHAETVPTF